MSYRFPSDEWIKEPSRLRNESDSYESSAPNWEGHFVFEVQPIVLRCALVPALWPEA